MEGERGKEGGRYREGGGRGCKETNYGKDESSEEVMQ